MAADAPDRAAVLTEVRTLAARSSPSLDEVERVLTDGYACVLHVEAERLRLQRRLEQQAATLTARSGSDVVEVSGLARSIARAEKELTELRAALSDLAALAQRLRAA